MKYKVKGHFPTPQTRCLVVQVILCPIGEHGCFMFILPSKRNLENIKDITLNINQQPMLRMSRRFPHVDHSKIISLRVKAADGPKASAYASVK